MLITCQSAIFRPAIKPSPALTADILFVRNYPKQSLPTKPKKRNRRRRLPNGFGQITEIKTGNLRNPFRVMVTVGKNEEGRPICKPLRPQAYFATYNEAYSSFAGFSSVIRLILAALQPSKTCTRGGIKPA